MSTQPPPPGESKGFVGILVLSLCSLLLAYPLSLGPVARFYKSSAPPPLVQSVYRPLEHCYNASPTARKFFDFYLKLWGVD